MTSPATTANDHVHNMGVVLPSRTRRRWQKLMLAILVPLGVSLNCEETSRADDLQPLSFVSQADDAETSALSRPSPVDDRPPSLGADFCGCSASETITPASCCWGRRCWG